MRTTVALISARPDTIVEDYGRLLDLAGLLPVASDRPPRLLVDAVDGFRPGWSATPWQLDGVLAALGDEVTRCRVAGLGERGAGSVAAGGPWAEVMARHGVASGAADLQRLHRPATRILHPALDAALPEGVRLPVALAGAPAWLLTAPMVRPGWGVAGASRLLRTLMTAGHKGGRRVPAAEVTAEAVGVVKDHLGETAALLDGCLWGVARGFAQRLCAVRNVLIAGRDPVAVDAVAAGLAGLEPLRVPWLRACHERGFGRAAPGEIRVVGATEVRQLDFDLPADTFAAGRDVPRDGLLGATARVADRLLGRDGRTDLSGTAWEDLHAAYLGGR
jgi:hypothetical protein